MEIQESEFFGNFFYSIMHGKEYAAYDVQAKKLTLEKSEKGLSQKTIRSESRTLCINYYLSQKLNVLFVLTAHIVREGEPRSRELEALNKYVEEVKDLERKVDES